MANNSIAYGFHSLLNMFGERITTQNVDEVWTKVGMWLTEHNRVTNNLISAWVMRTTKHQRRVYLPGSGTLQPATEWTTPDPVRPEGYYDVAYPIQGGATAYGFNRITAALATIEELNRILVMVEGQDRDWMRRHMLAAVLYSSSWTFSDPLYGDLTVQPLANDDTVTYLKRGGAQETDNHYLSQSADISSSDDPFPIIYADLAEHPDNMGPFVVYAATDLVSDIEALTDLVQPRDPMVNYGNDTDTIDMTNEFDVGRVRFGTEYIGRKNRMDIIEWPSLPSGILVAQAEGASEPLLMMREYPAAELQGFYTRDYEPSETLEKRAFYRDAGFGVNNRTSALVYQIGSASYTEPSGYTSMPLAV